ncbi:MAG: peptidoglycan bridge formation glycyltransferase FemA/FemB family protein [Patescibacteria group bacterium]
MKISFLKENSSKDWNRFIIENEGSFLQSFEWGEFQKKLGKQVYRIIVEENDQLLRAQIIKERIFLKDFLYVPYGPVFKKNISEEEKKESLNVFFKELQKQASVFMRIEPNDHLSDISNFKSEDSPKRIQPEKTLLLDLTRSESEIFNNFQSKTRYNIRLAEKKEIKIGFLNEYDPIFFDLIKKTRERQEISFYEEQYYKNIFDFQSDDFKVNLVLAELNNKVIVASLVVFFGNTVTSLHTGSDYKYRQFKAPHLLRWRIIQEAKSRGYELYDFWGINEEKYPGITYFKKGFSDYEFSYGQSKDIVFSNNWYKAYKFLRKILR